jgi:hypothetical protein
MTIDGRLGLCTRIQTPPKLEEQFFFLPTIYLSRTALTCVLPKSLHAVYQGILFRPPSELVADVISRCPYFPACGVNYRAKPYLRQDVSPERNLCRPAQVRDARLQGGVRVRRPPRGNSGQSCDKVYAGSREKFPRSPDRPLRLPRHQVCFNSTELVPYALDVCLHDETA